MVFIYNAVRSRKHGEIAGNDPWDARTIEWMTTSPPPEHNFDEIPVIHALDDFWHKKYVEDKGGKLVPVPSGGANGEEEHPVQETEEMHQAESHGASHGTGQGIHMPSPSYMPILAGLGLPIIGYGLIYGYYLCIAGGVIVLAGLYGWALEPGTE